MIMLTMWFGGGMIPTFLVMSRLGLVGSLWSLIVLSLLFPALMGPSGWICYALYNLAGNIPPIMIQRYNRPRM